MVPRKNLESWVWTIGTFFVVLALAAMARWLTFPLWSGRDNQVGTLLSAWNSGDPAAIVGTPGPLAWIEVSSVLVLILGTAGLAPAKVSVKPGLDMLTAAICGLIAAKLLLGFPTMPWADMWVWGATALLPAIAVLVWRFKHTD